MNFYLIAYDLNKEGQDYNKIKAAIKALGEAVFEQKSLAIVYSQYDEDTIVNHIIKNKSIDKNDMLFVTKVESCVSVNMKKTDDFIELKKQKSQS